MGAGHYRLGAVIKTHQGRKPAMIERSLECFGDVEALVPIRTLELAEDGYIERCI